ncbi:MAG: Fic family protein [Motilibacteraceae bacterium]
MSPSSRRASWPPVEYEQLSWTSRYEPGTAARTEMRRHSGPYQAAIVPPIAALEVPLPAAVAAAATDAAAEIARFDQEVGADIAPFAAILLRSESAASSQIENLTASARAIAEAALTDGSGRTNAAQVLANTRAMTAAIDLADALTGEAILSMHEALLRPHHPEIAGKWREEQVWIGGGRLGPHQAMFVPPAHHRVPAGIDDLVAFMRRDDIPALIHAAIAHAQFETIHPFPDGNGRTGRALLHAMLRGKGLTRAVTVPVSAGLLVDVEAYFTALTDYRAGDPAPIVDLLAAASFAAIANGRTLVADLRQVRDGWAGRVRVRRSSGSWRILDVLLRQPVVDAPLLARELGIATSNVYRLIAPLTEAEVLVETTSKTRGRIWRSAEVLAALDAFAARAGRRTRPAH